MNLDASTQFSLKCKKSTRNFHQKCTNFGVCHCYSTYYGANCQLQRRGSLPGKIDLKKGKSSRKAEKHWFLVLYIGLPILFIATAIIAAWARLKKRSVKEEESISNESRSEGNTQTHSSQYRSESSSQAITIND
ncbi:disintegrin and metalloproteinase domain-containing protein 32-like isoform X2 [Oryctolagus cuniculus]|uniref:disintegrin and metalloproteinase domain-containing protein 32-like isoform X2 n=1 Tax=Oryctolagus cuniculus TaxID=9986 RepID=UPI003879831B